MVVTTTTASALATGSALGGLSGTQRPEALFVLSAPAGGDDDRRRPVAAWSLTRFVSVSVLTGFLTGWR